MGTLTGSAISSTYTSLIFTDKTGTGIGDIYYTLANGDDQKLTTLSSQLTFDAKPIFAEGILVGETGAKAIRDFNGNESIWITATGSAVNYLRVNNSATGNSVSIESIGDDTNVSLTLAGKGTGDVTVTPLLTATAGVKLGNNIVYNSEGTATLTLDTDEDLTIAGDLQVSGGIIEGPTDNDLVIRSDGQMSFYIDYDDDESSQAFRFFDRLTEVASLDESGHLQIDGNITVGGNIIKASDGGSTITMDTSDNVTIGNALTTGGNLTIAAGADLVWDTTLDILLTTGSVSYLAFNESSTKITSHADVEMSVAGGLTQSPIVQTAATKTLDKFDSGHIIAVDTTSNDVAITLPAAADGLNFKFMITKAGSQDLEIISPSATNYFYGGVIHLDGDSSSDATQIATVVADYNSNDYLTLLVADAGTVVDVVCNGTLWYVAGTVNSVTAPTFGDASGL